MFEITSKKILNLHTSMITPKNYKGYILYVHGGPGFHSAYFESAIKSLKPFANLNYGWITYDQRGCARSEIGDIKEISHQTNIEDLNNLIKYLENTESIKIKAVFGHSYGSLLTYQTIESYNDIQVPIILSSYAPDTAKVRNRSFNIDMLELKMNQPDTYKEILKELRSHQGPLWKFQKTIREKAEPLKLRPYFMWGNLEVMDWYSKLKEKVSWTENWELCRQVASSVPIEDYEKIIDPRKLENRLLWINGAHDMLVGCDSYYSFHEKGITTFLASGHYPHLEEPERFCNEVRKFLEE